MMATGAIGAPAQERTSGWTQPEENSSSIKADDVGTADCSSPWRRRQKSTMKTVTTRTTGSTTCNSCIASATITCTGTDPRQDVLMTRALSLRSRVPGNWQARFWRPVERGDPSAEFNEETHRGQQVTPALTLPQIRYGLSLLLLEACCTPGIDSICRQIQRQLTRNESARFYHHRTRKCMSSCNLHRE